ncbi:hypothetical protein APY03_2166 [Variovorax sp. WDL1]|nr:hypothetical protein APY03_2166 [Variovorax sp. WDL1]
MGLGCSKARRCDLEAQTRVTFADVAGIDEAEGELGEVGSRRCWSARRWANRRSSR